MKMNSWLLFWRSKKEAEGFACFQSIHCAGSLYVREGSDEEEKGMAFVGCWEVVWHKETSRSNQGHFTTGSPLRGCGGRRNFLGVRDRLCTNVQLTSVPQQSQQLLLWIPQLRVSLQLTCGIPQKQQQQEEKEEVGNSTSELCLECVF